MAKLPTGATGVSKLPFTIVAALAPVARAMLMQAAGLQVIAPAVASDIKPLLEAAKNSERPTFWIDHALLFEEKWPAEGTSPPLGKAAIVRPGRDVTLVGYSMNDTIVIFDRVRENRKLTRKIGLEELLNRSVNQTLSRTVLTSGLTFVAVLCLFIFGAHHCGNF